MTESPGWRHRARCLSVDLDFFDTSDDRKVSALRRFCTGCSVQLECLSTAIALGPATGNAVFGGYTSAQRNKLRGLTLDELKSLIEHHGTTAPRNRHVTEPPKKGGV